MTIDTIKLRTSLTESQVQILRSKPDVKTFLSRKNGEFNKPVSRGRYICPALSDEMGWYVSWCNTGWVIDWEFSLPKAIFGTNILLYYPTDMLFYLEQIRLSFMDTYQMELPVLSEWRTHRLDLTYAWKLESEKHAEQLLDLFKTCSLSRKDAVRYETSVEYLGVTQKAKVYLKHPEFMQSKDFKELRRLSKLNQALGLAKLAEGVLRFELTLRIKALKYRFNKKQVLLSDILASPEWMEKELWRFLTGISLIQPSDVSQPTLKTLSEVADTLQQVYPKKAAILFAFFVTAKLGDEPRKMLRQLMGKSGWFWRRKQLINAGISWLTKDVDNSLFSPSLPIPSIPSPLAVNQTNEQAKAMMEEFNALTDKLVIPEVREC